MWSAFLLLLFYNSGERVPLSGELIYSNDFMSMDDWVVESNGAVELLNGEMRWTCAAATVMGTIWCRRPVKGPVRVQYEAMSVAGRDNFNFILYARSETGDLLESSDERTGIYVEYQVFPNYITTHVTDNEGRTRIRFRRGTTTATWPRPRICSCS